MAHNVVAGVFASLDAAERAKGRLIEAGVAEQCIAVSADLSGDDIAGEYPGQCFTNQPGQPDDADLEELYADAAHAGSCVVRVDLSGRQDGGSVEGVMRDCGAQQTTWLH